MTRDVAIGAWPFWRRMSFMASLSAAAGLSAQLYLTQLIADAPMREKEQN